MSHPDPADPAPAGAAAPPAAPWYAAHFGPGFADLLSGVLTAFLGQPLQLALASGHAASGTLAALAPGASVTLACCTLAPPAAGAGAAALPPLALAQDGSLRVPLAHVHAVRLPQGACVPGALAEAARALQPRAAAPRTSRGPRLPPPSGASGAAAPAAAPLLGVTWALHGWGEPLSLTL